MAETPGLEDDSTMVAVMLDGLEVPGSEVDDQHVTLAFLGGTSPEQAQAVADMLRRTLSGGRSGPLYGQIAGLGQFPDGGDGVPWYVPVDVPGLEQLREAVMSAVDRVPGVNVRRDHGYTPHTTLKYGGAQPKPVKPLKVSVASVSVVRGGQRADVPLTTPPNIDLAVTPGGRVGDASPLAKPGWTGGRRLDDYVRMVAHAFIRKGMGESHAIAAARTVLAKWARGEGNVTPKVRAAAVAALAHQKILDQKGHLDMSSDLESYGGVLNPGVDVRDLDLSSVATGDASELDLAPGDYHKPYDWRHGYIPLTPAAVRSKAKLDKGGKAKRARKVAGVGKVTPGKRRTGTFDHGPSSATSSNAGVKVEPPFARPAGVSRGSTVHVSRMTRSELNREADHRGMDRTGLSDAELRGKLRADSTPAGPKPKAAPVGPSAAEKIANAERMHGTGSKQHKAAQTRFGAQAAAEDDAGRGRGVPGAVEAATPKPRKRAAAKGPVEQVTRANAGDLDPGLHAELRRQGLIDADNATTAKGKRAGLKPHLEREAAMRANHKTGDPLPPAERGKGRNPAAEELATATIKAHVRLARTPGTPESTRSQQEDAARKLATKHGLDYTKLDEEVRASMYASDGSLKNKDDKIRAAGNHRSQAETQRARGDHEAAAYHEAQAEKYRPKAAQETAAAADPKLAKVTEDRGTPATEQLHKDYPVGARVKAGVAGNDQEVSGRVVGHTPEGMLRVAYRDRHDKPVTGTFNPAQARSLDKVTSDQIRARSGRDATFEGRGTPDPASGNSSTPSVVVTGDDGTVYRHTSGGGAWYATKGGKGKPEQVTSPAAIKRLEAERMRVIGERNSDLSPKTFDQLKRAHAQHVKNGNDVQAKRHAEAMQAKREAGLGPRVNVGGKMLASDHPDALAAVSGRQSQAAGNLRPPAGVSESAWKLLTPEQRKSAAEKIATGIPAARAIEDARAGTGAKGISSATAAKMSDTQLDTAVRRLMESGTYSGPALKVLEDEMNRRDKARAGKARGR